MRSWLMALLLVGGAAQAGDGREALRKAERGNNWEAALEAADALATGAPRASADAAHAAWRRAEALGYVGRQEEAEAGFAAFAKAFGAAADPPRETELAWGLTARGEWLGNRNRFPEAISQFDEVIARFGNRADPRFDPPLSKAAGMRAAALGRTGSTAEAMRGIDAVEARYGASSDPQVQAHVAMSMMVRGMMQADAKDEEAAIASFDRVIARYGTSEAVEPLQVAMIATMAKMSSLMSLKRLDEAKAVGRAVIDSIDEDMPQELKEAAAPVAFMMIALEMGEKMEAAAKDEMEGEPITIPAPQD
ncbi:MAG: tetratricopeptide repeat protein [Thermaurantiacus sp.]